MVEKYMVFTRNERAITAAATNQFGVATYTAEDDCTLVGVSVEVCIANEPPTTTQSNTAAGYARLVINRAGNTIPTIVQDADWDAPSSVQGLNHADAGDTWAIAPLAIGSGAINEATAAAMTNLNDRCVLAPRTKRKLRKGDVLQVETQYSNGGNGTSTFQEVVVGTLFVEG